MSGDLDKLKKALREGDYSSMKSPSKDQTTSVSSKNDSKDIDIEVQSIKRKRKSLLIFFIILSCTLIAIIVFLQLQSKNSDAISENEDYSHFIYDLSDIIVLNTTQDFDLIFDDTLKVYHQSENRTLKSIIEGTEQKYFSKWIVLKDSIVSVSKSVQNLYRYNYNKFYEIIRKSDGKHFRYEIAGFYEINPTSGKISKLKDETTKRINSNENSDFFVSVKRGVKDINVRSKPIDGKVINKVNENGQIQTEGSYKDGKDDGLYKTWHKNGQLQQEGNFKDGKYDGLYKTWYEDGQLKQKIKYKGGEQKSFKEWDENGQRTN